jgi:uncharacterized membrane protein YdjX (TVP38/TMEM64 family)
MSARAKLLWTAVVLIIVIMFIQTDTVSILLSGDPEELQKLSRGSMLMLMFITFALMIAQNFFPVIPLLLLVSMNVSIFGLNEGYIWSWFISIIGAIIAFTITRYWFQSLFHKYVSDSIKQRIEAHGFWFVILGKLLPFMPSSLVNIAAGGSSVRFNNFFLATIIGNTVYYCLLYLISQGLLNIQWSRWY